MIKLREDKRKECPELIFFNHALEYFDYHNNEQPESFSKLDYHQMNYAALLKNEMLLELNNLKEIIVNTPDNNLDGLNESERELFFKFIKYFAFCPVCGTRNHYYLLKQFYFDKEKENLKQSLIHLMTLKNKKQKFKYGIPCCNCFKKYLEKK
jgi:phosphatidylethanolamine-binding protein (PEBP) family uncharacterized protein